MSTIEWIAALTGLFCAWLTVKNRISNWPWGIVSVLLYAIVFWHAKLYANFGLQLLIFLPCCVYGWWVWARCGPTHNDDLPVERLSRARRIAWLVATIGLSLAIGYWMAHASDDPIPYADGCVTGASIAAQFLQAKKLFENWWLWIAVDALCVLYLAPSQHLYITGALYVLFFIVAIRGAIEWKPLIGKAVVRA